MPRAASSNGRARRWRAVSLRAAMALVAAVAVGLAWWTERARAHHRAVVELRRRGAAVTCDTVRGGPAGLWGPRPIPPAERWLRRRLGDWPFERVGYVGLGSQHGDAELELAGRLDEAQVVTVESDHVTDAGLAHLRGFRRLEQLALIGPGSKVGDAGLVHLAGLTRLEELDLYDPGVTDAGLAHLRGLWRLKHLAVSRSRVGDAGVEHLLGLDRLETLSLLDSALTDAGLARLAALPRLQHLGVRGTRVTAAGVAALRRARPGLHVDWSDPSQPVICRRPAATRLRLAHDSGPGGWPLLSGSGDPGPWPSGGWQGLAVLGNPGSGPRVARTTFRSCPGRDSDERLRVGPTATRGGTLSTASCGPGGP